MSSDRKVRILIVDDDPIVRSVVRQYIDAEPGFEIVAEYADGKAATAAALEHHPDVLLLDMLMPDLNGIEVLRAVSTCPSRECTGSVLFTQHRADC